METENSIYNQTFMIDGLCVPKEKLSFSNGVTVLPVGVEHTDEFYVENQRSIGELIRKHDFVVTEATQPYPFYRDVFKRSWENGKTVITTDPVSERQGYVIAEEVKGLLGFILTPMVGASLAYQSLIERKIDRRTFLKVLAVGMGALALRSGPSWDSITREGSDDTCPSHGNHPDPSDDFSLMVYRDTATLLGLENVSNFLEQGVKGVYFVGADHVLDYLAYSQNPALIRSAYDRNLYRKIDQKRGVFPHAIVWEPQKTLYKFRPSMVMPIK